jgi:phenylpropionate dioxygenase-like ring-hydroxylating dioxygenase large terminal subunit
VNTGVINANWKLAAEQFVNAMHHPEQTHVSAFLASIPEGADLSDYQLPTTGRQFTSPNGHGAGMWTDGPIFDLTVGTNVKKYWLETSYPAAVERLGKPRADIQAAHVCLFPASVMVMGFNHLRVIHPIAVDECEVWVWQLVPAAAPAALKKEWTVNSQRAFGIGGLFESDDSAVWTGVQRTVRGVMGQRAPLCMGMGDRQNKGPDPDYPGRITHRAYSEVAARGYYNRWLEMLTCDTWSDLERASKARYVEGVRQ